MDAFADSDLMTLARHRGPWCISVYLPTDRSANGMLQNPIRLKNLANQAEAMLVDHGLRAPEARKAPKPLADLLARKEFFREVSSGRAGPAERWKNLAGPQRRIAGPQSCSRAATVSRRGHAHTSDACLGDVITK